MAEEDKKIVTNLTKLKDKEKTEPIASFLDMKLLKLKTGYAKVSLKLKPEYLNFNGFVFNGIIMALADQALSYAANSTSYPSLDSQFNIHFIAAAAADDELTAECRVIRSGKRIGISEISVTNQDAKPIARATGTSVPVRSTPRASWMV